MKTVAICLLLLAPALCGAGAGTTAEPLADWTRESTEPTWTANDLYGRINGGAELFLEFGFVDLTVRSWARGDEALEVEVYRMSGPGAALGIYFAKRGRPTPIAGATVECSGSHFQLVGVGGDRYVQVNNFAGDEALLPAMVALMHDSLSDAPPAEAPRVLSMLPADGLKADSRRLVRGPFGLEPICTLGEGDILGLGGETFAAFGRYALDESEWSEIVVLYADETRAAAALKHLRANLDSYLTVVSEDEKLLVLKDWRGKFIEVAIDACETAALRIRLGLSPKP